jgi:glycosyltransferase involved in cell wall biosynthesis
MKPKLLMMFYVDLSSRKGDSIRTREIVNAMSEIYEVRFIGINSPLTIGAAQCYSVPRLPRALPVIWNFISLVYGVYCVLRFRPEAVYADAASGSLSPALVSMISAKPLFIEVHGPVGSGDISLYRTRGWLHTVTARCIENLMFLRATLVIGASGWTALVQQVHRVTDNKIVKTTLPVNHGLFRPLDSDQCRRKLGLPLDTPVAAFIGNVAPWQGLDTLMNAAPSVLTEHPKTIFLILGDGSARNSLVEQARSLQVAHAFNFVGAVPYEEVPLYIGACDVGLSIFPGNRGSRGGISAHKTRNYLACGRPVIVSEMDEMATVIEQTNSGKSVPPDDVSALGRALSLILGQLNSGNDLCINAAELGASLPSWDDYVGVISSRMKEYLTSSLSDFASVGPETNASVPK